LQIFFSPKRTFLTQKSLFKKYPFESRSPALARGEVGAWGDILFSFTFFTYYKTQKMSISQLVEQLLQNMIMVEGGTLEMDDKGNGKPITKNVNDFKIAKYLITQEQWMTVMGENPSHFNSKGNEAHPVEKVSWDDVKGFITKLNISTDKNFRLPTIPQWNFASKGGIKSKDFKYAGCNNLDNVAWYYKNSNNQTQPVGGKTPNELGIYDMNGNVFEWCNDLCSNSRDGSHVICGGSWSEKFDGGSRRGSAAPHLRIDDIGFRLVYD